MISNIPTARINAVLREGKVRALRAWSPLRRGLTYCLADGVFAPQKGLSVSIEKGGLAVVYGSRFLSKIRIRGSRSYGFEEEKYPPPESLANTVSLAIEELKARGVEATLSIPKEWALIRTVDLPVAVKENLASVVSYELDRLTPLAAAEALYDFRVLGEDEGRLAIVVWATRVSLVHPYIEALNKQGIKVRQVTVDLASLGALSHYMAQGMDTVFVASNDGNYRGGSMIAGALTSAIAGVFDDRPGVSRWETIRSELDLLISEVQKKNIQPRVLVFPADVGSINGTGDRDAAVEVIEDEQIRRTFSAGRSDVPRQAVGGIVEALWDKAGSLNLLSKGYEERKKTPYVVSVMLLALMGLLAFVLLMAPLERQAKKLEDLDRQIQARKEGVKKVEALKKEIETQSGEIALIEGFKEERPSAIAILKELTTELPKTVWLTRTRISDATVDIEGYAGSATEIISKLEGSEHFKKVEFASPTIRDTRLNSDRFVIKMEIEGTQAADSGEGPKDGKKK